MLLLFTFSLTDESRHVADSSRGRASRTGREIEPRSGRIGPESAVSSSRRCERVSHVRDSLAGLATGAPRESYTANTSASPRLSPCLSRATRGSPAGYRPPCARIGTRDRPIADGPNSRITADRRWSPLVLARQASQAGTFYTTSS